MRQYLKGNNMAKIKIHSVGCYAHAQTSNTYNSKCKFLMLVVRV